MFFGDVNARARGLGTHLLGAGDLERLAAASSLGMLQNELGARGFLAPTGEPTALELSVRRRTADQMRLMSLWSHERREVLSVIFDDEERRAISALLRGAAQGVAAESRLTGLVSTERLPERALQTLAALPTIREVVGLLALWRHPFASALTGPARRARPSLFELDIALHRAFALRATQSARRGGSELRAYVRELVDLSNAGAALLHGPEKDQSVAERAFVPGGTRITPELFAQMLALEQRGMVAARLATLFKGSAFSGAFADAGEDLSRLESALLSAQIASQKKAARIDPLGPAPLIAFALGLRAQALNLRRVIWGVALGAPATVIRSELVVA